MIKHGADACIVVNGCLLVAKRSHKEKFFGGHWELPGGKTEENETPFQTIEREILEELGIIVKATEIVHHYEYDHNDNHYIWEVVKVELLNPVSEIQLNEHDEIRWIKTIDELDGEMVSDTMKEVIMTCLSKSC